MELSQPHPGQRTPEYAVQDYNGHVQYIHARNLSRAPNRECINFVVVVSIAGLVLIVSLAVMIVIGVTRGSSDPLFLVFFGLFTTAFGFFLPSPEYGGLLQLNKAPRSKRGTTPESHSPRKNPHISITNTFDRQSLVNTDNGLPRPARFANENNRHSLTQIEQDSLV
jgi:hypothetical protein